jgi:GxxExxY protein
MPSESNSFIFREETFLGVAMEVLNTLGHGLHERPYENSIIVECGLRGIPFQQQPRYPIDYKGSLVGEFIPDLILYGKIVVDTKTIDRITGHEIDKMLNCLKINGLPVGLILNFKHARLESKRIVR